MTNREWMESLSNKDLAKVLHEAPFEDCSLCPHDGVDCLGADDCLDAIKPWLEAKHKEGDCND